MGKIDFEIGFDFPDSILLGVLIAEGEHPEKGRFTCLQIGFIFVDLILYKYYDY